MKFIVLAGLISSLGPGLAAQQTSPGDEQRRESPNRRLSPTDAQDIQLKQEQMQKQAREQIGVIQALQAKQLETMKAANPGLYEAQKESMERQERIGKIVAGFRQGKLTDTQAQKELSPLVKENLKPDLGQIDDTIAALVKKLAFWKEVKKDPDVLIRQRVDEILGKRLPELPPGVRTRPEN